MNALAVLCGKGEYADLARKIQIIDGEYCFAFGKHQGKRLLDEPNYAQGVLSNDFPEETKSIIRQILGLSAMAP